MVSAALLATIAVGCLFAAARLRRASWPARGPHAAVVAWQALGLTWGISTIGALLAFGLAPYGRGVAGGLESLTRDALTHGLFLSGLAETPFAATQVAAIIAAFGLTLVLFWGLVASFIQVLRTRRRHRHLLRLVARDDPEVPGARVLDHPAAAAYCLPGVLNSQIVISVGALEVLDRHELAAVLAHEHAHLRQRHDLVLLPFSSLKRAFPRVGMMETCYNAVALLIEMCADDQARREHSPKELAMALVRFGTAGTAPVPAGALAATASAPEEPEVVTRVSRLLNPHAQLSRPETAAVLTTAITLMSTTLSLWHLPM
ncbi:beta-lactamase regulating signal transducer with metallopeptidase domain [Spinactinospora alkalitolerans]|uniref:Beta-lactamase regulating signal transducer with metallopeptidase domain n=1 Tax=Spinactinospora alkalitolerans TaxID=687207 RepID=A0A852TSK7_9ACTN|nr:M56 family metallopeptidase [Spinactinospora alkalitolerans]NYE45124.1 beta-lactamase regulating signal transducer with metallopeptidase domain [Spinactinospora alkalitolerans]